jgi:ligand-binding sensor domain-containing protein
MMIQKNWVRVFLKLIFFLLLFFNTVSISSQNEKISFEKYGVTEGLPEEYVSSMVQDHQGFIWFTTQNGLVKFDGYRMQVFKGDPSNPEKLRGRHHSEGLLLARDGKLWIGSVSDSGGLTFFNPKTEKFTNYVTNKKDSLKIPFENNFPLFEDIEENIWFTSFSFDTDESFLCKINSKTQKVSRYPYRVNLKNNDIVLNFTIAESKKDSSVWLRTADYDILRYDRKLDVFETQIKKGDLIPGTTARDSIIDLIPAGKSGLIPMANDSNLFLWDPMKRKVVETYNFPAHVELRAGSASFEDTHGNFWNSHHNNLTLINRELEKRQDFKFGQGVLSFKGAPKDIRYIKPILDENK